MTTPDEELEQKKEELALLKKKQELARLKAEQVEVDPSYQERKDKINQAISEYEEAATPMGIAKDIAGEATEKVPEYIGNIGGSAVGGVLGTLAGSNPYVSIPAGIAGGSILGQEIGKSFPSVGPNFGGFLGAALGGPSGAISGPLTGGVLGSASMGTAGQYLGRDLGMALRGYFGLEAPRVSEEDFPGTIKTTPPLDRGRESSILGDFGSNVFGDLIGRSIGLLPGSLQRLKEGFAAAKNWILPEAAGKEVLETEVGQTLAKMAQREQGGQLLSEMANPTLPTRITKDLRGVMEVLQERAKRISRAITTELGGYADKSLSTTGASQVFEENAPYLVKSKFFDKYGSLSEALNDVTKEGGRLDQVIFKRDTIAKELDTAVKEINQNSGQAIGIFTPERASIALQPLEAQIKQYGLNPEMSQRQDAMRNTLTKFISKIRDLSSGSVGGVPPGDLVKMNELYNQYRRGELSEFLVQQIGGEVQGQANSISMREGSLEAIKHIQEVLRAAIKDTTGEILTKRPGLTPKATVFQELNDEYSALASFRGLASRTDRTFGKAMSQKGADALVQTRGPGAFASNVASGGGVLGSLAKTVGASRGDISSGTAQELYAAGADKRVWQNVQDLIKVSEDPVELGSAVSRPWPRVSKQQAIISSALGTGTMVGNQMHQDANAQEEVLDLPTPIKTDLIPVAPTQKEGFQLSRNINELDPQGIANVMQVYFPPERATPLMLQWKKVSANGDKKQMAEFLGLVVDQYPDFPIERSTITGLNSEFDIGDGRMRLFSFNDRVKWEDQIRNSSLNTDEKALRTLQLRKDGIVVPFDAKLAIQPPPKSQEDPNDRALNYLLHNYEFSSRERTPQGSRRVD